MHHNSYCARKILHILVDGERIGPVVRIIFFFTFFVVASMAAVSSDSDSWITMLLSHKELAHKSPESRRPIFSFSNKII